MDEIEAERLFETALTAFKTGRLPGTGYKLSIDCCRQLIKKFPGSEFEYKAKNIEYPGTITVTSSTGQYVAAEVDK